MKELLPIIKDQAAPFKIESAAIMAFIEVETGGYGFDTDNGKLLIQFEPAWFKKQAPYAPSGLWSVNKVDVQSWEWKAFNDAFSISPKTAMMSTSIGLGQILGLHYKRLGFASVNKMWDAAKSGLPAQIWMICKFIDTDVRLKAALIAHDWNRVASIYNGSGYKALAIKYHRLPYDQSLKIAYLKYNGL